MARAKAKREPESELSKWRELAGWRPEAALLLATLIFYWIPLTDPQTSIQWDAVDVHYSSQKYFADHITRGELPFWLPYIFSGFPFLADPVLTLVDGNGNIVQSNNDWKDTQQAAIQATGLAPPNDLEAAILATVSAGNYTVILSGNGVGSGIGLVEVYKL